MTDDLPMDPYGAKAPIVDPDCLKSWIIDDDEEVLVVDKPGWIVCHPSKNGPYSSLLGAFQEYVKHPLHLVTRLDRETSGLVIFAKNPEVASRYQRAMQKRRVAKQYLTILEGNLAEATLVEQSIGRRLCGPVIVKSAVHSRPGSRRAVTEFEPLVTRNDYTVCRVIPKTGRTHQIRVHAEWLGFPIVGDKIYGPDETLFLDFIMHGWTERLAKFLPMKRQALHCERYVFDFGEETRTFEAKVPDDMRSFSREYLGVDLPIEFP